MERGTFSVDVPVPGSTPSNIENGLGYVAAVTAWTIPFHRCEIAGDTPADGFFCTTVFDDRSASIEGRLIPGPCANAVSMVDIYLTERLPGGASYTRSWKSGWDGRYRFEGIEAGAELSLRLDSDTEAADLPVLAPGERYVVPELPVPCPTPAA